MVPLRASESAATTTCKHEQEDDQTGPEEKPKSGRKPSAPPSVPPRLALPSCRLSLVKPRPTVCWRRVRAPQLGAPERPTVSSARRALQPAAPPPSGRPVLEPAADQLTQRTQAS